MSDEMIVRHCSPTLAGLKTGSMFTCAFEDAHTMRESMRALNRSLMKKGLKVVPLRQFKGRTLIYIYRPSRLRDDLKREGARKILGECGYDGTDPNKCISRLRLRLAENTDFPHEVGLFLGYPPEDVQGFILNPSHGFKCVGFWKVYGDAEAAQKLFEKYRICTHIYFKQLSRGRKIEDLAI